MPSSAVLGTPMHKRMVEIDYHKQTKQFEPPQPLLGPLVLDIELFEVGHSDLLKSDGLNTRTQNQTIYPSFTPLQLQ